MRGPRKAYPNFPHNFSAVIFDVERNGNVFTVHVGCLVEGCLQIDATVRPEEWLVYGYLWSLEN